MQASERRAEALWRLALDGADDHTVDEIPLEKRVDDDDRQHGADDRRVDQVLGENIVEILDDIADVLVGRPRLDPDKPIGMSADPRVQAMWDHLEQWTRYDLAEANQILDDLGLAVAAS